MKRSKQLALVIALLVAVSLAAVFLVTKAGTNSSSEASDDEDLTYDQMIDQEIESLAIEEEGNDFENPDYDNEIEGAEVNEKAAGESDFIGSWSAGSNRAHYLYGNIDITIKSDGKWSGNITDEDYSGTWSYNGEYVTLESDIVSCDLFFAEDGQLMFRDHTFPEDLVVLTKN